MSGGTASTRRPASVLGGAMRARPSALCTSTYWQTGSADDSTLDDEGPEEADDAEHAAPASEAAVRTWGRSKDHRPDLPQVVTGLAVTREGVPVRAWAFPGNTSDQVLVRTVKDDLRAWNLGRVIWVLDQVHIDDGAAGTASPSATTPTRPAGTPRCGARSSPGWKKPSRRAAPSRHVSRPSWPAS